MLSLLLGKYLAEDLLRACLCSTPQEAATELSVKRLHCLVLSHTGCQTFRGPTFWPTFGALGSFHFHLGTERYLVVVLVFTFLKTRDTGHLSTC